jgi:hypothetical protein
MLDRFSESSLNKLNCVDPWNVANDSHDTIAKSTSPGHPDPQQRRQFFRHALGIFGKKLFVDDVNDDITVGRDGNVKLAVKIRATPQTSLE